MPLRDEKRLFLRKLIKESIDAAKVDRLTSDLERTLRAAYSQARSLSLMLRRNGQQRVARKVEKELEEQILRLVQKTQKGTIEILQDDEETR